MRDFDDEFKVVNNTMKLFVLLWIVAVVASVVSSLAVLGGLIYLLVHILGG